MALMLPEPLEFAFAALGVPWPTENEDELDSCGDAHRACAVAIREKVTPVAHAAVNRVTTDNLGDDSDEVAKYWARYQDEEGSGHLADLAQHHENLADLHKLAAALVKAVKIVFILLAYWIAAVLIWAVAFASFTAVTGALRARASLVAGRSIARRFYDAFRDVLDRQSVGVVRRIKAHLENIRDADSPQRARDRDLAEAPNPEQRAKVAGHQYRPREVELLDEADYLPEYALREMEKNYYKIRAAMSQMPGGIPTTPQDIQKLLRYIQANPYGRDNCLESTWAVQEILRGRPAVAGYSVPPKDTPLKANDLGVEGSPIMQDPRVRNFTGADPRPVVAHMEQAGEGAEATLLLKLPNQGIGHTAVVKNINGKVYWIDGQHQVITDKYPYGKNNVAGFGLLP